MSSVYFERFKSLFEVGCAFTDAWLPTDSNLTVLTGPNGAGKTNVVHALTFLSQAYSHGLEHAVGSAGGFDNIVHRRARRARGPVNVAVQLELDEADLTGRVGDHRYEYWHRFSFVAREGGGLADYVVVNDEIEICALDNLDQVYFSLRREEDRMRVEFPNVTTSSARRAAAEVVRDAMGPFNREDLAELLTSAPLSATGLFVEGNAIGPVLRSVRQFLSRIEALQLAPASARAPGVPTPSAALGRHGENLPGAAEHLRRNDPEAWDAVQSAMRWILPGLKAIKLVYTTERRLAVIFEESGVGRGWNADEVSDGTIQALALFISLYDRRNALLVVEEPENAVHPWVLRQLVDLCRAQRHLQVLLTTHSPVLLSYVDPQTVQLLSVSEGRTSITPLLEASGELRRLVESGELGAFDIYDSGVLPTVVPGGFSPEPRGGAAEGR